MAKILVVDDEPDLREILVRIVAGSGHEVLAAGNGASAIKMAHDVRPALVILDLMMPETDGFEVLRTIRADPATSNTPVVIYSALSDKNSRDRAAAMGAQKYLVKNEVGIRELRLMVEEFTGNGAAQAQS